MHSLYCGQLIFRPPHVMSQLTATECTAQRCPMSFPHCDSDCCMAYADQCQRYCKQVKAAGVAVGTTGKHHTFAGPLRVCVSLLCGRSMVLAPATVQFTLNPKEVSSGPELTSMAPPQGVPLNAAISAPFWRKHDSCAQRFLRLVHKCFFVRLAYMAAAAVLFTWTCSMHMCISSVYTCCRHSP